MPSILVYALPSNYTMPPLGPHRDGEGRHGGDGQGGAARQVPDHLRGQVPATSHLTLLHSPHGHCSEENKI